MSSRKRSILISAAAKFEFLNALELFMEIMNRFFSIRYSNCVRNHEPYASLALLASPRQCQYQNIGPPHCRRTLHFQSRGQCHCLCDVLLCAPANGISIRHKRPNCVAWQRFRWHLMCPAAAQLPVSSRTLLCAIGALSC